MLRIPTGGGSNANGLCWRFLAEPTGVMRYLKYMARDTDPEFESDMPSHAVWSLWICPGCRIVCGYDRLAEADLLGHVFAWLLWIVVGDG